VVDDGLDGFARESAVDDPLWKDVRTLVAPAEFQDKTIPHVTLLVGALRAARLDPREDLLVGSALERPFFDVDMSDAKKPTATAVEHEELIVAQVADVLCGKFAGGVEPDLVEHAAEIDESPYFVVTTAQSRNVRHAFTIVVPGAPASARRLTASEGTVLRQ
jgi:hypothetical protein